MDIEPCSRYTRTRVKRLFKGKQYLTLPQIAKLRIPHADRLWVLLRKDVTDKSVLKSYSIKILTRAITDHVLHCGIAQAEQWAQNWLRGKGRTAKSAQKIYDLVQSKRLNLRTVLLTILAAEQLQRLDVQRMVRYITAAVAYSNEQEFYKMVDKEGCRQIEEFLMCLETKQK